MLGKKQNAMIIICANIATLLIIYLGIIAINFFSEEEIVTKKTIVGINPITKTSMFYQEPLVITLGEIQKAEKQNEIEIKKNIEESNVEEIHSEQQTEELKKEITAENVIEPVENMKRIEAKEEIPTRLQRIYYHWKNRNS